MTEERKVIYLIKCWLCFLIVGIGLLVGRNEVKAAEDFILAPISGFRIKALDGDRLRVQWTEEDYAYGYEAQCSSNKKFPKRERFDYESNWYSPEAIFDGLVAGKTYYVRVRGYIVLEDGPIYSRWSKVLKVKVPRQISGLRVEESHFEEEVIVNWKGSSGADGYHFQCSSSEKFQKKGRMGFETHEDCGVFLNDLIDLTAGKYYYIRVREFIVEQGIKAYGQWSKVLKVKVPKPISGFKVKSSKGKVLKAEWKISKEVDGYELECSRDKDFGPMITSEASKNIYHEATIKKNKLTAGKYYYMRIRGYKLQQGVKIYSKWSKALKVKVKK